MGRKNRNNNSKEIDNVYISDNDENLFIEEKHQLKMEQENEKKIDILWDTYTSMIEYCNFNKIPVCEYMDFRIFHEFVDYLLTESYQ